MFPKPDCQRVVLFGSMWLRMRLPCLFFASLLLVVCFKPRAEEPDDQFVRIFNLVQQADASAEGGQSERARQNYLEAQEGLKNLQKSHPTWNEKVIQFRLNYIAQKLNSLTAVTRPETAREVQKPATASPTADESDGQIKMLQEQIRKLSAGRDLLESRLKEALSAQPASVDPRELTKAEDRIKALQKEIEVFKVNLAKAEARPDKPIDPATFEETRKALAAANQKLGQQAEVIAALGLEREALQNRLQSSADAAASKALRDENAKLKSEVTELQARVTTAGKADEWKRQMTALQADLIAEKSRNEVLTAEKRILEDRLKGFEVKRNSDLAANSRASERERTEAMTVIQTSAAEISVLQSALRIAHEEQAKLAKENADLEARLASTQSGSSVRQVREGSTNQTVLHARLDASENQKAPYAGKEMALMKASERALVKADAKSGRNPSSEPSANAVTLVAEAEQAFSVRRLNEAEQKYQQALRTDEKNVLVLANLAAVQIEQNRLPEAEASLKRALARDSKDAFSLSLLGILKVRQQKFDEALDPLSQSAQLDPQNADTFQYLGVTLAEKGLRDPAESAFRRAIQLSPGNADAHHNLAVVYATQRPAALELARWHYKKSLESGHPRNPKLETMLNEPRTASASK